jgi:ribosomal protein L11 methyltransferase
VIRLAVRVRREDAELVLAELLELAPGGVEEVDDGDVVEYAVYGAPGELPALPSLRAAAGEALVDVVTSEVADDWDRRWREFHRPVEAGGLRVRAPWHDAREGDVVIDPGQAFGTGAHPTTRLCLELLAGLGDAGPRPPAAAVDLGCGSGVLAIAAARIGFAPVLGLDCDPLAIEATLDNARANGVRVAARRFDLRAEGVPEAPLVLANLLRPLLLDVRFAGAPPRALIASGLLEREGDEVAAAYAERFGLAERARATGDGWVALDLRAPEGR